MTRNNKIKMKKHIAISSDIHEKLMAYCKSQPEGGQIYRLAEKLFKDFLTRKGIFLD
ncbi:MAG: hypothetical protein NT118_03275 [Lentisphaerae bacterium]|nr:hypothetical protein [Lentisphaerota bacterium]